MLFTGILSTSGEEILSQPRTGQAGGRSDPCYHVAEAEFETPLSPALGLAGPTHQAVPTLCVFRAVITPQDLSQWKHTADSKHLQSDPEPALQHVSNKQGLA